MKTLFLSLFVFLGIQSFGQKEFRLFFNPKVKYAKLYDAPYLIKSEQLYKIRNYDDSTVITNNALKFVMLKESTIVYFDGKFEGEFVSQNWKNYDHFIIYFIESKTYYYFHFNI